MKVGIILNPVSGGGRAVGHGPAVREALAALAKTVELCESRHPGHAPVLAEDFAARGFDLVIAFGGDGTIGEVTDGLMRHQPGEGAKRPELGFITAGTGSDFSRNFAPRTSPAEAARALFHAVPKPVDVGHVDHVDADGVRVSRHFINIASFGVSGAIAAAVNRTRAKGTSCGPLVYFLASLKALLTYPFPTVSIRIDDGAAETQKIALVAIANGAWFGGGMKVAPDADVSDGLFDVVIIAATTRLRLLGNLLQVYTGRHRFSPNVRMLRARKLSVEPVTVKGSEGVLLDIDGESPGRAPARYGMKPGALLLRV